MSLNSSKNEKILNILWCIENGNIQTSDENLKYLRSLVF